MEQKNKPSDIKIKPIKLIVKKPQKVKKKNKTEPINKKEQGIINLFTSIRYILILSLLLVSIILITNIVTELEKEPTSNPKAILANNSIDGLISNWQTNSGYTITFTDNNTFYIYESGIETFNNYYIGKYDYIENNDAITKMGYTSLEELKKDFNIENYLNIYLIELKPESYYHNNKDIISRKIEKNEKWNLIFIIKDNKNAIAYNKTLDIRYKLTRS